jgi:hypothetical protein
MQEKIKEKAKGMKKEDENTKNIEGNKKENSEQDEEGGQRER